MKTNVFSMATGLAALAAALLAASSCDMRMNEETGTGSLKIHFLEDSSILVTDASTKATSVVDTNDFILSVTDSKGASLYYGTFGAAPETIVTAAGTYTVSVKSCDFTTPLFATPQYGDTQVVVVKTGATCNVVLDCVQMNSGVRLNIDSNFLTEYPNGVLYLKSADGKLMYGYSEKRIAYFNPGNVSLVLNNGGTETTICSRKLEAREVLVLNLDVAASADGSAAGIHVQLDTSRTWTSESLQIGGGSSDKGSDKSDALSVPAAKENIGAEDVWVYGYIVGGDLSSSKCSFEAPFSSRTNLVIAAKSSCTDKESCLSVQLAQGSIRDDLNLVDNEELLGRMVYLRGDIVSAYYGIPGLQSISEYELK